MQRRRILVVDDEPDILEYFKKVLSDRFDVAVANGGAEALALLKKGRFDVVLTDVRMPGTDGLRVLESAKELSPHSEVLLMSGYSDLNVVIDALNEGAFAFVTKPVIKSVLIDRLEHAIAVIQQRENQQRVLAELKNDLLMQSRFAQRLSALAAMAGGIAHELHQPLSGISLYAGTVKSMLDKKKNVEKDFLLETMTKIDQQVERAIAVIEHIREFSSGGAEQEAEDMELGEAVRRALELFNYQLKAHSIELKIAVPDGIRICVDRNGFEQVMINLVSNAKDSMLEKTRDVFPQPSADIHITGQVEDSGITLDVQDKGTGVPDHLVGSLFDPFVTGKKNSGGSGLGLFICRRVLEEQGAQIELLRTGEDGSTFRLSFPKGVPQQAP
jgi:C4-dicarboxylate-specific signal transduction histidine kinase